MQILWQWSPRQFAFIIKLKFIRFWRTAPSLHSLRVVMHVHRKFHCIHTCIILESSAGVDKSKENHQNAQNLFSFGWPPMVSTAPLATTLIAMIPQKSQWSRIPFNFSCFRCLQFNCTSISVSLAASRIIYHFIFFVAHCVCVPDECVVCVYVRRQYSAQTKTPITMLNFHQWICALINLQTTIVCDIHLWFDS